MRLAAFGKLWANVRGLTVKLKANEGGNAEIIDEVELYSKSYALVVGIDDYANGWPRLGQAVKDAHRVSDALKARGFGVTLKTNLKSGELRRAFEDFFLEKGGDPDARLFVWYAGHGHTDERGEGYLIPADGVLERDRVKFLRTSLSLRRFGEFVRLARSKHVFTIFDSCFAGTIFNVARSAPPPQITRLTTRPVRQFLTSGDAGQTVSDDGTFAKLFVQAIGGERRADLNNDGFLTASEIGSFLDTKISNYTRNKQTPRYGKLRSPEFDQGDFVFSLGAATLSTAKRAVTTTPQQADREALLWEAAKDGNTIADYDTYLKHFPDGMFATMAKRRMGEIIAKAKAKKSPSKLALAPVQKKLSPNQRRLQEGRQYLIANKQTTDVIERPSGLQYKVIRPAPSGRRPSKTDTVSVHYQGSLIDGTVFDSSYKRGKPAAFPVNAVINGWQEALLLMRVGEKWQIFIPSHLAYGKRGTGPIRPNETLLFEVELLAIQ
ncbi:MAG: hypothetical protein HOK54_12225 [Alphaproteobacteria bacterium]|jgi:FKBP-type peptidyl-prolyl cis-trans isomerase|nr:hypothetical protein [Alphaproteobacteria bacterium]